jgi:glycosyltransferase involved in cell wall biosynthesis
VVHPVQPPEYIGMSRELVSIILRTKDRPLLLEQAVRSIAAQTYRPIEAVLVNDGGCGLDLVRLGGLLGDVSLTCVSLAENQGRAHAANVGIHNARGAYVGFLDDDDEFYPDHVAVLADSLAAHTSIAYTDAEIIHRTYDFQAGTHTENEGKIFTSRDFSFPELLLENYIALITVMFRRDVLGETGAFDEGLRAYEDWDYFIRCGARYPFKHVPRVTARYIQWNAEQQIAQSPDSWDSLLVEYEKIVTKHHGRFNPETVRKLRDAFNSLRAARQELDESEKAVRSLRNSMAEQEAFIENLTSQIVELNSRLGEKEDFIARLQSARGWRCLLHYYHVKERVINVFR